MPDSLQSQIDKEIHHLEQDHIRDFVLQTDPLLDLETKMVASSTILFAMEDVLSKFYLDLGGAIEDIQRVQEESARIRQRSMNLNRMLTLLDQFVDHVSVQQFETINVSKCDLTPDFLAFLAALNVRITTLRSHDQAILASTDSLLKLVGIRNSACRAICDRLGSSMELLDHQMARDIHLTPHRQFLAFLTLHSPDLAERVVEHYVKAARTLHREAIAECIRHLFKSITPRATQDDLQPVSAPGPGLFGLFSSSPVVLRHEAFKLDGRDSVLHGGGDMSQIEGAFRAVQLAIIDRAVAEFRFIRGFFQTDQPLQLFRRVMSAAIELARVELEARVTGDPVALYLCILVNARHSDHAQCREDVDRAIFSGVFEPYEILLRPRLQALLDVVVNGLDRLTTRDLHGLDHGQLVQKYSHLLAAIVHLNSETGHASLSVRAGQLLAALDRVIERAGSVMESSQESRTRFMAHHYQILRQALESLVSDPGNRFRQEVASRCRKFCIC